ncbi:hypothetical protein BST61_g4387 [Cercospora zeina]
MGGTIADLMDVQDRSLATAVWAMGAIIGPTLGPVIGAFVTEDAGWRWVFWLIAIIGGLVAIPCLFLMQETHEPTILRRQVVTSPGKGPEQGDVRATGNELSSHRLRDAALRPLSLLCTDLSVLSLSVYSALAAAYLYILLTTLAETYTTIYGFSIGIAGLVYLSLGIGAIAGQIIYSMLSDRSVSYHTARGNYKPEYRLLWMPIGSIAMPLGLIWYGWMVEKRVHWIVSIIALFPCGVGLVIDMVAPIAYLIDACPDYTASAVAGTVVARALAASFLPLVGFPLYDRLGQGWGNSLLALIALLLAPLPILMFHFGERLRPRVGRMPILGSDS